MDISNEQLRYLQLLARDFPNIATASTEIINLQAILNLPKGTEHFLADLHGEYDAFQHVLRNASLPIITSTVAVLPMLFMGSLIMESFFGIPGLGSYTIDAVNAQDFSIVRAMVFLGTVAYIVGLILTDIVYTWVDPRIRLA